MPLTTIIIQHLRKWRQRVMRISDSRMKYVLEVMSGIRIVKLMGWEAAFLAKIGEIRVRELSLCARPLPSNSSILSTTTVVDVSLNW